MDEKWTELRKRFDEIPSRCAKRSRNWLEREYGITPIDEQNGALWKLTDVMTTIEKDIDRDIQYPPWYKHPTVSLVDPFTKTKVDIDVELAEVISLIWKCGVKTLSSCQCNGDEPIWIKFPDVSEYRKFVELVWIDSLYDENRSFKWKQDLHLGQIGEYNLFLDIVGPHHDIPDLYVKNLRMTVDAHIPRTDIPFIIAQLQRFNKDSIVPYKVSKNTKKLRTLAETHPYLTVRSLF